MVYFQVGNLSASSFRVTFNDGNLDLLVSAPPEYSGECRGLLGNGNGDSSDEFIFPNGTTLVDSLASNLTDVEIYEFGQAWQINEADSLFEYDGERSFSDYNPANYTPIFLSELRAQDLERTAEAEAVCGDDEMCLFDYLAVNSEFGMQTMQTGNTLEDDRNHLENLPPNVTAIIDFNDALQDEERVLCVRVNETINLGFTAMDANDDDIFFMLADSVPDGATVYNNGSFSWTPTSLNVSRIEIVVSDDRGANTSLSFNVKICQCENGGECDFTTQAVGQNLNANGYAVVTCNCTDGWSGDHCNEDLDSCADDPCYPGVFCTDNPPGSATDFECYECPPPLVGDGISCYDFNECNSSDTNDCDHICHNILGSYTCSCFEGFTLLLDGHTCDNSSCTPTARNNTGSANCTCDTGYQIKNETCMDFDECLSDVDNCPDGISTCINTAGDYFCECFDGYTTNNATKSCEDVNECARFTDDCDQTANFVCLNTIGNFTCICAENSTEFNGICIVATTLFLQGRFDFIFGLAVKDYPETIESDTTRAQLSNELFDFLNDTIFGDGSLIAVLVTNYTLSDEGLFAIVDFRVDTTNSTVNSDDLELAFIDSLPLTRTFGSNNRIAEEDVNECTEFADVCRNGYCTNTDGSFYCTCNMGFQGNGTDSCTDIDECLRDHGCQQICNNEEGAFSCACSDGYELENGGFNCTDIDECSRNSSLCDTVNGMCMNYVGSYNCSCNSGYELDVDGRTCNVLMTTVTDASTSMAVMDTDTSTTLAIMDTDASTTTGIMDTDPFTTMTMVATDASTTMAMMDTDPSTSMTMMATGTTMTMMAKDASTTMAIMDTDPSTTMTVMDTDPSTTMTMEATDASSTMAIMDTDASTTMTMVVTDSSSTMAIMDADPSTAMTMVVTDASSTMAIMDADASTTMAMMDADDSTTMAIVDTNTTTAMIDTDSSTSMTAVDINTTTMMARDASTTMSAPASQDVTIVFVITFVSSFSNELEDPMSTAFINLANAICTRFKEVFRMFTDRDIVCVVVRFRRGSVLADVNITATANNSADAQSIETNALNITNMDFGNVTTNNQTYIAASLSSNVTAIDECVSAPCMNGGTCMDGFNMYTCVCAAGYTGADCSININDCASNPCINGGTCTDGVNMYTCACAAGYTGVNCSTNIDDCASTPCMNGATCTDGVAMYICVCIAGYTGADCSTNIDECASTPCLNNGTCTDGVNMYTCACASGYSGVICTTDIDECASAPCMNGGTCTDGFNMFSCECAAGYAGANCSSTLVTTQVRITVVVNQRGGEDLVYTNSLTDPNSDDFQSLESVICGAVRQTLIRTHGETLIFYDCTAIGFSPGSVVADMQIDVGADTMERANAIADTTRAIPTMNGELTFGSDSINVVYRPEGLSTGAIIAIVLGVLGGILLIIICLCCISVQMTSRENAAKLALREAYHDRGAHATESPVFYGDDPFDSSHSYSSLDLRKYAVGRAAERIARDQALQKHVKARNNGHKNFRTPYVAGEDDGRSVERNPIYY